MTGQATSIASGLEAVKNLVLKCMMTFIDNLAHYDIIICLSRDPLSLHILYKFGHACGSEMSILFRTDYLDTLLSTFEVRIGCTQAKAIARAHLQNKVGFPKTHADGIPRDTLSHLHCLRLT